MQNFDQLPKSIKRAVRYIKQDASEEKLKQIKYIMERAFQLREEKNRRNITAPK
ncbi:hypothetical protein [Bacillus thermotolerans]|uniref:LytR family transcriptional regulator n=1 Tax=Bacillus thermotolerans TaxID=1221996 RepID=A0A0F5I4A0_BACTR|nr:hypothetical protein [Bacillus thermotolerans]KKB35766.1 hypothetical protein QY97_01564 [Bacillus thermotolerans]KKB40075.1 hypothetical protein QY95_01947 [Bacillus thermotolerans]